LSKGPREVQGLDDRKSEKGRYNMPRKGTSDQGANGCTKKVVEGKEEGGMIAEGIRRSIRDQVGGSLGKRNTPGEGEEGGGGGQRREKRGIISQKRKQKLVVTKRKYHRARGSGK